ncbi:MAG: acetate/propionate family kinase [Candidatus Paceibacterota bacterium]
MAITLVVNPGSSSKKYAIYQDSDLLISAYIERSEDGFEMCTAVRGTQQKCELLPRQDYQTSLRNFFDLALTEQVVTSTTEIKVVAVRIVAPGTFFQKHQLIDDRFMKELSKCVDLAPLHVPHMQKEISALRQIIPHAKFVAVSDSAFHASLPESARNYSLPSEVATELDLFRFGYHGLSVGAVLGRLHAVTGHDPKRVIVCHLGSGVSVTATKDGQSIDTTMGFAPGSGLVMGSRAGDLDAGALLTLMQSRNLKPKDAQMYLQTIGGLKGLSGESDLRFILDRRAKGDKLATQAIASFVYQIKKAIGAYFAVLNGLDTLVFTATAGERSSVLRALITAELSSLGILLDKDKNELTISRDGVISDISAKVKVVVIKVDEAKEILHASQTVVE